jgi:hypothetical protein
MSLSVSRRAPYRGRDDEAREEPKTNVDVRGETEGPSAALRLSHYPSPSACDSRETIPDAVRGSSPAGADVPRALGRALWLMTLACNAILYPAISLYL